MCVSMDGTDICCEIERRVNDGFVYSEAVTRYRLSSVYLGFFGYISSITLVLIGISWH